jgi:hypothetical protein
MVQLMNDVTNGNNNNKDTKCRNNDKSHFKPQVRVSPRVSHFTRTVVSVIFF